MLLHVWPGYANMHKEEIPMPIPTLTKNCLYCEVEFTTRYTQKKFCCFDHQQMYWYKVRQAVSQALKDGTLPQVSQ